MCTHLSLVPELYLPTHHQQICKSIQASSPVRSFSHQFPLTSSWLPCQPHHPHYLHYHRFLSSFTFGPRVLRANMHPSSIPPPALRSGIFSFVSPLRTMEVLFTGGIRILISSGDRISTNTCLVGKLSWLFGPVRSRFQPLLIAGFGTSRVSCLACLVRDGLVRCTTRNSTRNLDSRTIRVELSGLGFRLAAELQHYGELLSSKLTETKYTRKLIRS